MEERSFTAPSARESDPLTFARIAEKVGGKTVGLEEDFPVTGVATLEESRPGWVSFISSPRYCAQAEQSKASGFLTTSETVIPNRPCIVLDNVWKGMLFLLEHFHAAPSPEPSVHHTALIGSGVSLGEHVSVGPFAVIEEDATIGNHVRIGPLCFIGRGTRIGDHTLLHPKVCVMHNCEIGRRVILHPGVVIGADGFKYELIDGCLTKIPQVGRVVLEDDVEIGANSCVDRASLSETRIGRGVKIDNLCQIAHNVSVGAGSVMAAQVGIAGSTQVGEGCYFGGQVGLADNIQVGNRVKIGAKAGVNGNVPDDAYYLGTPALDARQCMRMFADFKHLPDMRNRLRKLEKKIDKREEAEKQNTADP